MGITAISKQLLDSVFEISRIIKFEVGVTYQLSETPHPIIVSPSSERIDGLTLETSAFESLYGAQFTSTQLLKPNYLVIFPSDAAPQFLQKLTPKNCPLVFLSALHRS